MSDPIPDLLKRFDEAIVAGDTPAACALLGEVRSLLGDRSDVLAGHGHLLLTLGQVAAAEDAAWRSVALDPTHDETLKLVGRLQVQARGANLGKLKPLPGTPYAEYALPLDYPPSRRYEPRWGYGMAPHGRLTAMFAQRHSDYEALIAEMRTLAPFLDKISAEFSAPEAGWVGPPINAIDLALLYYFVWKHRPATYLEIGSGSTTCFARRAVRDHGLATRVVSIDPQPRSSIDSICDEVLRDGLETMPSLQVFADLQPGDIVFMDGSHRCFMNSDVTVFFLEVLPLLKPGVIVHIHDISLPYDYAAMFKPWYWNEQYVLAAYLLGMGDRIRVLLPSQYVSGTEGLKDCLQPPIVAGKGPEGSWLNGGSFWFTHV